ncbi:major facilitator superfamily domain-containing protein [Ilyonectria sp. MPI-CAGE-AT-0026]|nr:major facilitator superfamily domain-containing protein [Ilyonectria sp. MPI-CAGE-AT-0026]
MTLRGSSDLKDGANLAENESYTDHINDIVDQAQHDAIQERNLLRKIDWHVLPWLCVAYALSLIDRTNIAAAKIVGMVQDLNLHGSMYSVALLVFFITYILTEIPSNAIVKHLGTRIYLAILLVSWGAVAMCFGFIKNYGQLVALRVLLGFFEGGFNPACIFVISCWYKPYEVQRRLSIWFVFGSVVSGFGGILSYGLSMMEGDGGLRGWRWIFIVPGAFTVALALPVFLWAPEFPESSKWTNTATLQLARERLSESQAEGSEERTTVGGLLAAASDWKVYVLAMLLMLPTAGSYSLAFFTPSILSSFGFSVALSQILTTPPYIFSAIISVATGIVADRVKMRSPFIIGYSLLVIVGLTMMGWGNNTGARLVGIFLAVTGNNCAIPSALAFLSNNVVDTRKRQFAVPIQTVFGGIGGIVGAVVFREQDYPGYRPGLYASFGCMSLNIVLAGCLALYLARENKKADEEGKVLEGIHGYRYTL